MMRPPVVFDALESGSLESLLVSTDNIFFLNLLAALDICFIGLIYLHVIRVCLPVFFLLLTLHSPLMNSFQSVACSIKATH